MACFDDLSEEIHELIGRILSCEWHNWEVGDRRSLASLCATSKRYQRIFTPHLYSRVSFEDKTTISNSQVLFITMLFSSESIGKHLWMLRLCDIDAKGVDCTALQMLAKASLVQ